LWNLKLKGVKDRDFKGHDDPVLNVSVNHDSSRFVTCDNSGKGEGERGAKDGRSEATTLYNISIVWDVTRIIPAVHITSRAKYHLEKIVGGTFGKLT